MFRRSLVALAFVAAPSLGSAQLIRGTVTDRTSSAPLPGVLVTLETVPGSADDDMAVLSNGRGEFAIRALGAGRYRLTAKRIGVQRFISAPIDLAAGETRRIDIALDPMAQSLPEVRVADYDLCVSRAAERSQVVALWDEARTVLTAARVSLRDRLFDGQLTRYFRGLDPRSLRVLEESWSELQGVMDRPFVGLSGDSLSKVGYRRVVGEYTYYYAPDAEVLVSRAFQRDHCFRAVEGGRDRRGLVGLGFEPAPSRIMPDVRGTLWLDAHTFELQFVEFLFTGMERFPGSDKVGGEVHFARLPNGSWVTSRWFLRMPQEGRLVRPVDASTRFPSVVLRPTLHRLVEEGGIVFTAGLRHFQKPAAVAGLVLDSAGLPFGGTSVRIGGMPYVAVTEGDGRFRLDSLPAGRFTLIVEHPRYALLGSFVTDQVVELREGATASVTLRADRTDDLVGRLCDGTQPKRENATLRVVVTDSATSRPLPTLRVWLRWVGDYVGSDPKQALPSKVGGIESLTNADGAVAFCDVPADIPLIFSALRPDGKPAADSTIIRVNKGELKAWLVQTRRPGATTSPST